MNKTKINAEIVAHSLSPQGDELISVLCTFPRIILAEINTHRMLSKNTSSSRAIPFKKMVEAVQNNPFIPIAWQKSHSGMQGTEYFNTHASITKDYNQDIHYGFWMDARDEAIRMATCLHDEGLTKQLCNRLLEPFMWTTMLITGSKEGWNNFFKLRCPVYEQWYYNDDGSQDFEIRRSKKEYISRSGYPNSIFFVRPDESKIAMLEATDLDWLQRNKGQSEIHMMALAEAIYDAMNESTPKQLQADQWHIPMISDLESLKLSTDDQIKLSVGRAANTSYTVVGDGKELTLEQAIKIHNKCKELNHSSVFEHCARVMSDDEYYSYVKGTVDAKIDADGFINIEGHTNLNVFGWCNNLKGFIPYRYFIDNKIEL